MNANIIFLSLLCFMGINPGSVKFYTLDNDDPFQQHVMVNFTLHPGQHLYKEYLDFSIDHPDFFIKDIQPDREPISQYDPGFKESKKVFNRNVTFDLTIQKKAESDATNTALSVSYLFNTQSSVQQDIHQLTFKPLPEAHQKPVAQHPAKIKQQKAKLRTTQAPASASIFSSFSSYISSLIKTSESLWFRFILVFLLGVLLSLTPCIYPMIPITVGILQSYGSKSLGYNVLVALTYTCGMAFTFALFGLLASCAGPLCGQLLVQPIFVIVLVSLLAYFALSMFGLYDLYIPKFLKQGSTFKGGSLLSVFAFGAMSGSIASPCVSPGLALVLSVVALLGSKILGFLLLFVFGIGLSTPLLIVGTFSSSLNLLPRAGLWMMEIKRLLGFVMLLMCFYYLSYITPLYLILYLLAALFLATGIFYLYIYQTMHSAFWYRFEQLLGISFIVISLLLAYYGYKQSVLSHSTTCTIDQLWEKDWQCALQKATIQNKKIFIDFWATFCPVCIAINKTVLTDPLIKESLEKYVNLKVDGTFSSNEPYASLKNKFEITGFPVFIIYDPSTDMVTARFGAELYDMNKKELAEILQALK